MTVEWWNETAFFTKKDLDVAAGNVLKHREMMEKFEAEVRAQAEEARNSQYLAIVIFGLPVLLAIAAGLAELVKHL